MGLFHCSCSNECILETDDLAFHSVDSIVKSVLDLHIDSKSIEWTVSGLVSGEINFILIRSGFRQHTNIYGDAWNAIRYLYLHFQWFCSQTQEAFIR